VAGRHKDHEFDKQDKVDPLAGIRKLLVGEERGENSLCGNELTICQDLRVLATMSILVGMGI
jgi:hypothetical protein